MRPTILPLGAALSALAMLTPASGAQQPPPCQPGCQVVKEVTYKEVVTKVCREVQDVQKITKWVYSCRCEDYCAPRIIPPASAFRGGCCGADSGCADSGCGDSCSACGIPRTKRLLVKEKVEVECPITKCVVECQTVKVPCVSYRQVPCGNVPCAGATQAEATVSNTSAPAARASFGNAH